MEADSTGPQDGSTLEPLFHATLDPPVISIQPCS